MITTHRTADSRSEHYSRSKKKPARSPVPLDAERQSLAAGFTADTCRMANAFKARHARDVPADELIGEALVALVNAASLFKPEKGIPFKAWAVLVIHHAMIHAAHRWRQWRKACEWPTRSDGEPLETPGSPDADVDDHLDAEAMLARVQANIPARSYRVLWLRFADGLSYREIGQRHNCSTTWAKIMATKAIDAARQSIAV